MEFLVIEFTLLLNEPSVFKRSVHFTNELMILYAHTSFILYSCLGLIASAGFDAIAKEVRSQKSDVLFAWSRTETDDIIQQWKRKHEIVTDYLHQLNRSFGPILFIEISWIFFGFVIHSFYIILIVQVGLPLEQCSFAIISLVNHTISLIFISFIAGNIKGKVRY